MRAFLDAILEFIASESLTDVEFDTVDEDLEAAYTKEVYDALKSIVDAREGVSTQGDRLKYYFLAKGIEIDDTARTPKSNIFIGAEL